MLTGFIALYIFMLAAFTGYEIIGRVPSILHTPLMWRDKAETFALAEDLGGAALLRLVVEETQTKSGPSRATKSASDLRGDPSRPSVCWRSWCSVVRTSRRDSSV